VSSTFLARIWIHCPWRTDCSLSAELFLREHCAMSCWRWRVPGPSAGTSQLGFAGLVALCEEVGCRPDESRRMLRSWLRTQKAGVALSEFRGTYEEIKFLAEHSDGRPYNLCCCAQGVLTSRGRSCGTGCDCFMWRLERSRVLVAYCGARGAGRRSRFSRNLWRRNCVVVRCTVVQRVMAWNGHFVVGDDYWTHVRRDTLCCMAPGGAFDCVLVGWVGTQLDVLLVSGARMDASVQRAVLLVGQRRLFLWRRLRMLLHVCVRAVQRGADSRTKICRATPVPRRVAAWICALVERRYTRFSGGAAWD
jgi:hypothetical protein